MRRLCIPVIGRTRCWASPKVIVPATHLEQAPSRSQTKYIITRSISTEIRLIWCAPIFHLIPLLAIWTIRICYLAIRFGQTSRAARNNNSNMSLIWRRVAFWWVGSNTTHHWRHSIRCQPFECLAREVDVGSVAFFVLRQYELFLIFSIFAWIY